ILLYQCPYLRVLNLSMCSITDFGMKQISLAGGSLEVCSVSASFLQPKFTIHTTCLAFAKDFDTPYIPTPHPLTSTPHPHPLPHLHPQPYATPPTLRRC